MMNNMDQFQGQANNQFGGFGNQHNPSLNNIQIQPSGGDFTMNENGNMGFNNNNSNGNMMLNSNGNGNMNNAMNNNGNNHNNGGNNKPAKRKAETYSCTVCAIEVSSQDVLQSHINGQKHAKKLRQISDTQTKTPSNGQTQVDVANTESGTQQPNSNDTKSVLQQINELASFHKLKVTYDVISEKGPQHAKIFEIKCALLELKTNTTLESVTTTGSSHAKAKQTAGEILIKQTKLEFPSKEHLSKKRNEPKKEQQKKKKNEKHAANATNNQTKQNNKGPREPKSAVEVAYDEYEQLNKYFIKNHLLAKHKQIQPSREQLDLISHLVQNIEKGLKKISDKLVDEELPKVAIIESTTTETTETTEITETTETTETKDDTKPSDSREIHRHLKGVVRVGTIVKTLFLKTDRDIHLVVLTSSPPTYSFIKRISEELESELVLMTKEQDEARNAELEKEKVEKPVVAESNEVEMTPVDGAVATQKNQETGNGLNYQTTYQPPKVIYHLEKTEALIKTEACIEIKCELPDSEFLAETDDHYRIKISFTSMSLVQANSENPSEQKTSDVSLEKCKEALTEIRRVKWFNARLKPIANAILILRIMRDLCQRSPTWSVLNDWLLELVIDKCFLKNKYEDITLKLRTVFECISNGILFMPKLSIQHKPYEAPEPMVTEKSNDTGMKSDVEDITKEVVKPKAIEKSLKAIENSVTLGFCDPCAEIKSETNVFDAYLTIQQSEELTLAAQNSLRLIAFRKTHELLAIDVIKMSAHPYKNKRPHHFDGKFKRFNRSKEQNTSEVEEVVKVEESAVKAETMAVESN